MIFFAKYQGAGNDFILVDDRLLRFPLNDSPFIRHLCRRKQGIGADGLILLQSSQRADFRMRIFNSDGFEAEMCGNGIRCLVKEIRRLGFLQESYRIETKAGDVVCHLDKESVIVEMGKPEVRDWEIKLPLDGKSATIYALDTGVPHAVTFVEELERVEVDRLGREVRFCERFQPGGVNVNFATITSSGDVCLRTYERGVEGETLACGTGVAATAFVVATLHGIKTPLKMIVSSRDVLEATLTERNEIIVKGPAEFVFEGILSV